MPELIPKNNARGTIADNPLTDTATTLNLDTGQGALFNDPAAGVDGVRAIITDPDETVFEIIAIIERASDALTIVRGIEAPFDTPLEWPQGSKVAEVFTEEGMAVLLAQGLEAGAISFDPTGTIDAANVQDAIVEVASEAGGLVTAYACVRDEKTATTQGGDPSGSGSWIKRTLNTVHHDAEDILTLASDQVTLDAGEYVCRARAPFYKSARVKIRLRNVTDGTTVLVGDSAYTGAGIENQTYATLSGRFTIAASKALELQYWIGNDPGDGNGLGVSSDTDEIEIYSVAEFWKIG